MDDTPRSTPPNPADAQAPAATPPAPAAKPKRHLEFFSVLFLVFVFGWAASYVGSSRGVEWLYFLGLALVGLPLLVLMAWLGH